jgi:hypothetical protein
MANLVKLLPHQGQLVQAPYVFPEINFFFLVAGYASGKTSGLTKAIEKAVKDLLGKKDLEKHNPKILIASKNLTFMKKTLTGLLEQDLKETNSEYTYDKAHNIITVGNVELLLIPDEDESNIYGFSCACFRDGTKIMTLMGEKNIEDITEMDYVLTRKGFKKVKHTWCNGERDCIEVNVEGTKIICTPDHRFIDSFNNEVEAQDLTKTTSLVKIDTKEWRKWLSTSGKIDESLTLLISMVSGITDTPILSLTEKGVITPAQMRIRRKVIQLCTEICGLLSTVQFRKGMMCTTKTETLLTTLLRTLSLLQGKNTLRSIGNFSLKKNGNKLLKQLSKLRKSLLSYGKMSSTKRSEKLNSKSLLKTEVLNVSVNAVEESLKHTLSELLTALMSVREMPLTVLPEQHTEQGTESQEYVLSVEKSLKQTSIPQPQLAHLTAKTSSVVGRYMVYDIEVEDCHEFFANGVLVHNCAFVDELDELDTQTAMAVVKSINDRCRQQVDGFRSPFMVYTTSSQGLKGTYQTVMHFKKSGIGYVLMRAETRMNTYLPKDYVDNMYAIYNEKERACLLEGKFVSIDSGLIFPDYNPERNKLDSDLYEYARDNNLPIYIGQDFNGFGNNAVAFCIINGAIIAIKDYEFPDIRRAPEVFRYDFPTNEILWIPDMTYKEHFVEFKKELRTFNIKIAYRSCNPLVGDRNFACNKLFIAEHLFICPMCKDLETTLLTWQKDPRTGQPSKGGKGAPDHKGDCLGYVVHYLLSWKKELKPLYRVTLERIYEKRRARGADATELEVTSNVLDPSRLKGISLKQAPNVVEE